jgi:hypothetical protein
MSRAAFVRVKPDKVKRLQSRLYELMSRRPEVRGTFLHASHRNTGVDSKVIQDKIGGSG